MIISNTLEPYYSRPEDDFDQEEEDKFTAEYCGTCSNPEDGAISHEDCKCGRYPEEDEEEEEEDEFDGRDQYLIERKTRTGNLKNLGNLGNVSAQMKTTTFRYGQRMQYRRLLKRAPLFRLL